MIYTVTCNPSLDYIVRVENFQLGTVNRTSSEKILPGGKGINVSIVLKNLGFESIALGFTAGFTGQKVETELNKMGCASEFEHIDQGFTRINLKLKSREESEINGQGPLITQEHLQKLQQRLEVLQDGDILIFAGSIPQTLPEDTYENIIARLQGRGIKVVVDATGNLLKKVLKYHPFLIKPNNHELGDLFGVTLKTKEEVVPYARKLQELGAANVLVSMAKEGAVLLAEDGSVYSREAPKGEVVNSVGAGDSMVAGFIAGYLQYHTYEAAFKGGIAAGSASAFSENLATREEAEELLHRMEEGK
ncbi:MAG: 1-phosphofructokinase [Lachnospiraceae bacterium]